MEDYHGTYKARLTRMHQLRPMAPDNRLWTPADIAAADVPTPPALVEAPAAEDPETAIEQRMARALSERNPYYPLIRLRDIHDVAGTILCRPLQMKNVQQLATLLTAARAISIGAEPGSEIELWEKHYRLMLDAIDLDMMLTALPEANAEPAISFATSTGNKLDWAGVRATAKRIGAKAVFFAAADESYVEQYARFYALSVLKYCDVPFVIVTLVIGGEGRLKAIAKSVGIDDERLIFAADRFDASAVATGCFDAPPKGRSERPIAHYQSARFQKLCALLANLKRPVFVSDIDLLLQRGVADLLQTHADADVVLNENDHNEAAGSRLTANLLLLNPTANAALFARFLRAYLDRALSGAEVSRWIDQVALTLARHHLRIRGYEARIGYFDTKSDINNVMYRTYQAHPFRFLSLFHGFDVSSLEPEMRVQSDEAPSGTAPAKPTRSKRKASAAAIRPAGKKSTAPLARSRKSLSWKGRNNEHRQSRIGDRRSGIYRLPSLRAAARSGAAKSLRRQFLYRLAQRNIAHLLGNPRFELMRHDVTFPLYVEVDEIYNLACPASPIHYQFDPVQTTKTSACTARSTCWALPSGVKAKILQASTSEVYGDPDVHPQTRRILGQRQPDRPALLLRRGQALRRNAVLRLLAPAQAAHQGRPHLQHLRPADASQ